MKKKRYIHRDSAFWRDQVTHWQESGLSQSEYCRQQGLNPRSLSRWSRELIRKSDKKAPSFDTPKSPSQRRHRTPSFVEIQAGDISIKESREYIELILEGMRIRFREDIDPWRLRSIIQAMYGV